MVAPYQYALFTTVSGLSGPVECVGMATMQKCFITSAISMFANLLKAVREMTPHQYALFKTDSVLLEWPCGMPIERAGRPTLLHMLELQKCVTLLPSLYSVWFEWAWDALDDKVNYAIITACYIME